MTAPITGIFALVAAVVVFLALRAGVKFRAASSRGRGVRVYDLGADVDLPARLHARSYQIAVYLTMKSRAADPASPVVKAPVAPR